MGNQPLATPHVSPTSYSVATPDSESKSGSDAASILVDRERQLMEKGYVLRQQSQDADALAAYSEAYALRHDAKPLAQMALALEGRSWDALHWWFNPQEQPCGSTALWLAQPRSIGLCC